VIDPTSLPAHRRPRAHAWLALMAASAVSCAGRIPLPKHLEVKDLGELRARMAAHKPAVEKYFAEARLTYFGPEGRLKGGVTLAVARPASLRYDLVGPAGVVEAFATNGKELQLLNASESRFWYGPASVANVDRLMALAPLRLDAAGWVALLFGEIDVPADGRWRYDDQRGRFVVEWPKDAARVEIELEPETAQITRARVFQGAQVLTDVVIEARDPRGLPSGLRLKAPDRGVDLKVTLVDIDYDPESLTPEAFVLTPPAGVQPEYLGG
jgi:hypothetical protein